MSFETVENVLNINTGEMMTLALAVILLLIGYAVKSKVPFLTKYCIPAPVVGGFLFMFITFAGHMTNTFAFNFTNSFQSVFMLAFFTTVGLGASFSLLKKGGLLLIVYWLCSALISIIQNALAIGVGTAVGVPSPYALLCGAISMIGGHGAAAAYGQTFMDMGYSAGMTVGAAAATFGLISGVMLGGPLARFMIEKNGLKPEDDNTSYTEIEKVNAANGVKLSALDVIKNVSVIIVCMAVGQMVSGWIGSLINMSFPEYVGAMFVAVIARNLNDKLHFYTFSFSLVDGIGDVMLNLYLSLAMMTLALWELTDLLGGMLVILLLQVLVMALYSDFFVFRILGKNYDAAVMCSGLCGHGLGATPTAIVNMTAVCEKYGMSRRAFMIVPIVGAFLVDIIYQPQTIAFIKFFVQGYPG